MEQMMFKIVYGIGWAFIVIIRIPPHRRARTNRIVVDRKTAREASLLALEVVGGGLASTHLHLHVLDEFRQL